jgi:hypothetical protein
MFARSSLTCVGFYVVKLYGFKMVAAVGLVEVARRWQLYRECINCIIWDENEQIRVGVPV